MTRAAVAVALISATPAAHATDIYMSVSAYADPSTRSLAGLTYTLVPDATIAEQGLEYRGYAAQIERLLTAKGMTRAIEPKNANVAVLVSYGIGDPKTQQVSYALPFYNAPTVFTPYGHTSWVPASTEQTTYHRWLTISAVTPTNMKAEAWRVDVKSDGSISDLRSIFPYLLYAASPYLAKDTSKAIEVKTKHEGKDIKRFLADANAGPKPRS